MRIELSRRVVGPSNVTEPFRGLDARQTRKREAGSEKWEKLSLANRQLPRALAGVNKMSESRAQASQMIRAVEVYRGNCAKSTFYQWVKAGRVRLYRVGGASYTDEDFPTIVRRLASEEQAAEANRGKAGRDAARKSRKKHGATGRERVI